MFLCQKVQLPVAVTCGLHYAAEVKCRQWMGRAESTVAGLEWMLCPGSGSLLAGAMFSRLVDTAHHVFQPPPATHSAPLLPGRPLDHMEVFCLVGFLFFQWDGLGIPTKNWDTGHMTVGCTGTRVLLSTWEENLSWDPRE